MNKVKTLIVVSVLLAVTFFAGMVYNAINTRATLSEACYSAQTDRYVEGYNKGGLDSAMNLYSLTENCTVARLTVPSDTVTLAYSLQRADCEPINTMEENENGTKG